MPWGTFAQGRNWRAKIKGSIFYIFYSCASAKYDIFCNPNVFAVSSL